MTSGIREGGPMDVHEIGAHVLSADAWRLRGVGRARLRTMVAERRLVIAHRGWYVDAKVWDAWYVEQRHAAQVIAVWRAQRGSQAAFSHTAAAVIHGLPLYRVLPSRVHVSDPRTNGRVGSEASVARHEVSIDGDVVDVRRIASDQPCAHGGRPHRSGAGRVRGVTCRCRPALDGMDQRRPQYDETQDELFRAEVQACAALKRGARGSVQARWVAAFADGRAEGPGESVSRVHLHRLGFAQPRLQVRIARTRGYYDVDFGLDDVGLWGEFDGDGKYTDPAMRGDATPLEVVMAEKRREETSAESLGGASFAGGGRTSLRPRRCAVGSRSSAHALRARPGAMPRAFASRV